MSEEKTTKNFIEEIIAEDLRTGKRNSVVTRFPPEPNGYLHIGHAKAIAVDFGMAAKNGGECHLRFDDTNPAKEEAEFAESIKEDVKWLGFDWGEHLYYASDYFEKMYDLAKKLIADGKAYVEELNAEEIREYRGTLTEVGKNSPFRDRPIEENLDLFEKMKNGDFADGSKVLRAKIDMTSPNINFRDPVMYRIVNATHHRTGDSWHIYPMYDWAHGLEDSFEGITHSLCTLEFESHRPLYDWFIDQLDIHHPRQIEFARLNLTYTVMSKRKLQKLVEDNLVDGWDDPRMPTISGMRRRGYPAVAIRNFCDRIGLAKRDSTVDMALLEFHVREELNKTCNRYMGVVAPLKVTITNYPEGETEILEAINNPADPDNSETRQVPFSRELYIEQADFMEDAPKKFYRMSQGREIRFRYAYFVKCNDVVKDENGKVIELLCTYDPETKGGNAPDGRKVKATIHWVSVAHAVKSEIRLYDRLFKSENPDKNEDGGDFISNINPDSMQITKNAFVEPELAEIPAGESVQLERVGYFCADRDTTTKNPIFNRTVTLRDTWAKVQKKR